MAILTSVASMTHNPRIYWSAESAAEDNRHAGREAFAVARDTVERSKPGPGHCNSK
jgi:hypothetical protein